jgi:arginyl-tRNA synthetase
MPRLLLPYISDRKARYGSDATVGLREDPEGGRKKVLVEFSSPNLAQDFRADHLKSTILGAFVANVHESMGWDVVRTNFLGDWGKHLGLLVLGWKKRNADEVLKGHKEPFRFIHEVFSDMDEELKPQLAAMREAQINKDDATVAVEQPELIKERDAEFKKMEDGEAEAIAWWEQLRKISIDYYESTYARLNLKFDEYSGESRVWLSQEAITEVESALKDKGISEDKDGAWVIDFDKHGAPRLGTGTVRGKDGSSTYLLRDIVTVFERSKAHQFDKMIYVVGEQEVHFRQTFKAVELMGHADLADKLQHLGFPRVTTNWGNAKLLGDMLDQCEEHIARAMSADSDAYQDGECNAVAKATGVSALVVQELNPPRKKVSHANGLDVGHLTSLDGETGPGLQLCYARLRSMIESTGTKVAPEDIPNLDYSSLWDAPWIELLRLLARYPEITSSAFKTLDASAILSYLFILMDELSHCMDDAEEDDEEGQGSSAGSMYAARAFRWCSGIMRKSKTTLALWKGVRIRIEIALNRLGTVSGTV